MHRVEVCIAGAGVIGLSLALELQHHGADVLVLEAAQPLAHASTAAAGMLAANDPDNPLALHPLSALSLKLYPAFLDAIRTLSQIPVPFQTRSAFQAIPPSSPRPPLSHTELHHLVPQLHPGAQRFIRLAEHSLDPRNLAAALLAAIHATRIDLQPHTPVVSITATEAGVEIRSPSTTITAKHFVDCTGSWSRVPQISPRKGQMLSVTLPPGLPLKDVVRTPDIYIVPRTLGPQAGRAIIGATVEDAGFDTTVHPADITRLLHRASELLPPLADAAVTESWAGLRPSTPDHLPLLGPHPTLPSCFVATGHFRNGILLAPATAFVLADLISGIAPSLDLSAFSPVRFPAT